MCQPLYQKFGLIINLDPHESYERKIEPITSLPLTIVAGAFLTPFLLANKFGGNFGKTLYWLECCVFCLDAVGFWVHWWFAVNAFSASLTIRVCQNRRIACFA